VFCDTISGIEMWSYVRSYAKYVNEKLCTYRVMGYDFCKVKRGSVIHSDVHSLLCISTVFVVEKCLSVHDNPGMYHSGSSYRYHLNFFTN